MATDVYPVHLAVDYPDRPLNRLTSAFRIFTVIPIVIVLAALESSNDSWDPRRRDGTRGGATGIGLLFLAPC